MGFPHYSIVGVYVQIYDVRSNEDSHFSRVPPSCGFRGVLGHPNGLTIPFLFFPSPPSLSLFSLFALSLSFPLRPFLPPPSLPLPVSLSDPFLPLSLSSQGLSSTL